MIQENGGDKLLIIYKYSAGKMITTLFPEYEWKNLLFQDVQAQSGQLKQYLEDAAKKLGLKNLDDWYNVTLLQLTAIAGSNM